VACATQKSNFQTRSKPVLQGKYAFSVIGNVWSGQGAFRPRRTQAPMLLGLVGARGASPVRWQDVKNAGIS